MDAELRRFEGDWDAFEVGGVEGYCRFIIDGNRLEFMGAQSWFVSRLLMDEDRESGRFMLLIEDSPLKQDNGKSLPCVYRFEVDELTIVLGGPDYMDYPRYFDKPEGCRLFRLNK